VSDGVPVTNGEEKEDGRSKGWIKPGEVRNPAGRPKGTRNKLGEDFLKDLHDAWKTKGKGAIDCVVKDRPHEFLKVVAGLLPKDINIKVDALSEIDDTELAACLASLRALANTCSAEIARAGAIEAESAEPAEAVRPVH
jgi:hypothetical protein